MPSIARMFLLVLTSQAFCAAAVSGSLTRSAKSVEADGTVTSVSPRKATSSSSLIVAASESDASTVLQARVQDMLQDVENMARSGADPEPDKIRTIKSIVENDLLPDLKDTRDGAADQVKKNLAAVDKCNSNAVSTLQNIKASTEVSVGQARTTHATCREAEKGKNSTKGERCSALDNFLNGVNVPADLPGGRPRDPMVQYVKTMSDYFCPKGPEVTSLDEACKKAEAEHAKHKSGCDKLQAAFELGFCTWRTELFDTCAALSTCYESKLKFYNDHVTATKELVKNWKVEYGALKKILCYTDVWLSDNNVKTADADKFNHCQSTNIDTSPMDIDYGTPAAQAQCSMAAVEKHPGTDAFVTTEYSNFNAYVVDVIPCLPCGSTTPSPETSTTMPPITTLPEGHGFDGTHIVNWMIQKEYAAQDKGLCGLKLDDKVDALYSSGNGGEWVKYFKSGSKNAGCGGACNKDDGINMECHYIGKSVGNLRGVSAFAKTYLISDSDKQVTLYLGSDDGIAAWVNGKSVFQNLKACRCYANRQETVSIQLKKGVNLLVIKVGENDGHFGFVAELDKTDGIQAAEEADYTP